MSCSELYLSKPFLLFTMEYHSPFLALTWAMTADAEPVEAKRFHEDENDVGHVLMVSVT